MAGPIANSWRTSAIKSRILNVAQTSVYQVKLQPPSLVNSFLDSRGFSYSQDGTNVELLCNATTLPGPNFYTHEVKNDHAGVTERMVYRKDFDSSVDFTFMVDHKYDVVEMFDGWMDFIAGYNEDPEEDANQALGYRMRYPNEYRSDNVYISKFEKNVNSVGGGDSSYQMTYQLIGAYPKQVQPTQVNYDRSQVLSYTVSMGFIRYIRTRERLK
jgi:hypothetical protein